MKHAAIALLAGWLVLPLPVHTQARPDFSGTWKWVSRSVPHPLTIHQTGDELTIESLGLPQGNPVSELFQLDGSSATTTYDGGAFWQKQETSARWAGNDFVGTVRANARWKDGGPALTVRTEMPHTVCTRTLRLGSDGKTLTIATSCFSPGTGRHDDSTDQFVKSGP